MRLVIGMVLMFLAQILTFLQVQGHLKYQSFKENYWLVVLMGIPISMMYMESIRQIIIHYGGLLWPGRIIGFGIGVIVFAVMANCVFGETLNMKTTVSLGVATILILIQLFWK